MNVSRLLRLLQAAVTAMTIASCATSSEPVPSPSPGETPQQIADRHEEFSTSYRFWLEGHTYGLASATARAKTWWLVVIDDTLACRLEFDDSAELRHVEWLGEADGLAYLADRLRQACGLAPSTPPRAIPDDAIASTMSVESAAVAPVQEQQQFSGGWELDHDGVGGPVRPPRRTTAAEVAWMAVGIVLLPVIIPAWMIAEGVVGAPYEPPYRAGERQQARIDLPIPAGQLAHTAGAPELRYLMPRAGTEVWVYGFDEPSKMFFAGVSGDQVTWVARFDPWLYDQAVAARGANAAGQ